MPTDTFASRSDDAFLKAMLDTVHDGLIVIDQRGIIRLANQAVVSLFGFGAEELVGNNVSMLMPQPHAGAHDGFIARYLGSGEAHIIGIGREVEGRRKDGSLFPMELAVSEFSIGGDRFFVGLTRDISDRRQAMEQLAIQGAALEAAANAVLIADRNGTITWVNSAFSRLTGYAPAEVIGRTPRILKSGTVSDRSYRELWETVLSGRVWQGEIVNRRRDGQTYIEEQTITPVRGARGEISHFVAIKQDVTARKRAQDELENKNSLIALTAHTERIHGRIMELFSEGQDQRNILGRLMEAVAEHRAVLAGAVYLYDEWAGNLRMEASHAAPRGLRQEIRPGEGLVGQAARDLKMLVLGADQAAPLSVDAGLFPVAPAGAYAAPIAYQGRLLGVLVLAVGQPPDEAMRGFVERVAGQIGVGLNNIRQFHDLKALSEQLKQRGREVARKNAQLEEASRLKSEFLANMSHELRTPLNAIIGFSEVLKDGLLGEMNEEQVDYTKDIFDSANHLLSLINDILDLSKIEAGKMVLDPSEVGIAELLQNSLSIVKEKAHAHRIHLQLNMPEDVGSIQADARKLKQIVFNLMSNAVKFTPDGGRVTLSACRNGEFLEIDVADTGIGISAEDIGKLFRPFEQLDGSLSRRYEGTGLGLAMVKRLVELHGGSVAVKSQVGEGSVFSIRLPGNAPAHGLDGEVGMASQRPAWAAPLAMVLESEDELFFLMDSQLKGDGYRVTRAATADEATALLSRERPGIIVVDVHFSASREWEFFLSIKESSDWADIPVLLVSLQGTEHGLALGSVDVMEKPVSKDALLGLLEKVVPTWTQDRPPRVLVVDDDPHAVEVVSVHLGGQGFEVLAAHGGRQAIELALEKVPDLVILDLMMPEITGFDVVAALRADASTHAIPVVILTAKVLTEEDSRKLAGRVAQVLEKSTFDAESFLAEVRGALGLAGARRGGKPTVLVVEDNDDQAGLLRLYLEDLGCRVARAANGREALDMLSDLRPSFITLDLLMPEMDGFAFLEAKAARPEWSAIPVVVISAVADQDQGHPIAADAVLQKPIRRQELLAAVGAYLAEPGEARRKILLVDDDPKAVKIMSSYLPPEQCEVLVAFGGRDGLELAKFEKPDLILLDLMMPDFSGFEVLAELKKDPDTAAIPVMVVSAKILTEDERRWLHDRVEGIAEKGRAGRDHIRQAIQTIFSRGNRL